MNHLPMRGDAVEAWLKRQRDGYDNGNAEWYALDGLLDEYRLMSDEGRPMLVEN